VSFIKIHGVYITFWLIMWSASMVGVYWAVRLAMEHALRNGRM
jgi:hypothetical protein